MKTLFLAVHEITVWGWSFTGGQDAIKNAKQWAEVIDDTTDFRIVEIEVPDTATEDNFSGCADLREYVQVAERLKHTE